MKRKALQKDFDSPHVQAMSLDLGRFWSEEAYAEYGEPEDVHSEVGARLDAEAPGTVLDIGCGTGLLRKSLRAEWVGVDRSTEQLRQTPGRRAIADALALPFADDTFGAVATLYTLYFFEEPSLVGAEARRVLKSDG